MLRNPSKLPRIILLAPRANKSPDPSAQLFLRATRSISIARITSAQTNGFNQNPGQCTIIQSRRPKVGPNNATNKIIKRSANTSSGSYAPSTLASSKRIRSHEQTRILNVFEESNHLPSLPVPSLTNTMQRLKESISPVAMNSTEFANALALIDEFSKSAGPKLDLLLNEKAKQTKNWLTHDWWVKEIYLKSRQPLVINSNPAMVYPEFPFEINNQHLLIRHIANLISGIIDFKLSLIHGLNPEATCAESEYRLDPNLCYDQYRNLFGSSRVPGELEDSRVESSNIANSEGGPFSIIISFKGKFYEVQLRDIDKEQERIDRISSILDKIILSTPPADNNDERDLNGLGLLTTADRETWAQTIRLLDEESIQTITESQFVVCIDTIASPEDSESNNFSNDLLSCSPDSDKYYAALGRQVLHGCDSNVGNRWFDKAFQLIVATDERAERWLGAGINYEHSFGEGVIITKMIEHSFDKTVQKNRDQSNSNFFGKQQVCAQEPAIFRQLRMFDEANSAPISEHLKRCKQDFHSRLAQFDLSYLRYKEYGSNSIKSWQFSPDSWFQVALQSAYYNIHQRLGSCYESASTRRFAYGRTETIRSLTRDVADFCLDPNFDTMQEAIRSHKAYAISASNGDAIDRAILGYKLTFDELKNSTWSWGIPSSIVPPSKPARASDNADEITINRAVGLDDIFTEKELSTIISFLNNELIRRSFRFALSTSQVSSLHPNIFMTFGPLLADGYGCCYNITGQQTVASITANSSNQSFSCEVHRLNESIRESLDKMRDIVEEHRPKCRNI